jgi:TnpA family transposase
MQRNSRQILTKEQRQQFTTISNTIDEWELGAHYTLSEEDRKIIRRRRRDANRIGYAIQLCVLRHTGWPYSELEEIPYRVLDYIRNQLDIEPETFYQYAQREETRWEHLALIRKDYGYQSFSLTEYRKTSKEIFPHAMENSNGIQLMDLAIDSLRKRKVILPAVSTIERLVWDTRRRAEDKIYRSIDSSLSDDQKDYLNQIIESQLQNGKTPLGWLKEDPGHPSPNACMKSIEQMKYIRELGIELESKGIHPQRMRQLARLGKTYEPHSFRRFHDKKRFALLVAYLFELSQDITDQVIEISRRQIAGLLSKGKKNKMRSKNKMGKH